MRESTLHALRHLEVEEAEDAIIISGRVSSYYHKQLAQELIRGLCDGVELRNTVDVDQQDL